MPNINSGNIRPSIKQECFDSNRDLFEIIYCLGRGFMLSDHLYTYGRVLFDLSEKAISRKLLNMCSKGLLLEKEATATETKIYVLSKYVKAKYESKTSQNVSSVRITERKLWKNLYSNEYIIRNILPFMIDRDMEMSISAVFSLLERNFITFYGTQNREDVFRLYGQFYDLFHMEESGAFLRDYNAIAGELYLFDKNFLKMEVADGYDACLKERKNRILEKDMFADEDDRNRYFYNLYQFVMNGFFFNGLPKDRTVKVGLFTGHLTFEKVYKQSAFILLMLERYLGYMPKLQVSVYISDIGAASEIKTDAERRAFNTKKYEFNEHIRKHEVLKSLGIREQYWGNIEIAFVYFGLKEKYDL